jgi:hypothetical protein
MTSLTNPLASWGARYAREVEASISWNNWLNERQPVYTRQMTEEEKQQIFGGNADYIKTISRHDGRQWSRVQ